MKNRIKTMERRLEEVLRNGGMLITLTYEDVPIQEEKAKREMQNFIHRLKRWRKKKEIPAMKYVAVTEFMNSRVHHHLVVDAMDITLNEMKNIWGLGESGVSPLESGKDYLSLARYLTKDDEKDQNKGLFSNRPTKGTLNGILI